MSEYRWDSRDEAVQFLDSDEASHIPVGSHIEQDHDAGGYVLIGPDGAKLGDVAATPAKVEPREAQPGDWVATTEPLPPAMLRIVAQRMANQSGKPVILRDATDLSVVLETLYPQPKGTKTPRGNGPTAIQEAIIELCSRPEGATSFELVDAVCRTGLLNAEIGKIAWKQLVDGCTKYGYVYGEDARMVDATNKKGVTIRKPASVYKLIAEVAAEAAD